MAYAGGRAAAVAALAAAASETIAALEVRKGEAEAAANALQDQYDIAKKKADLLETDLLLENERTSVLQTEVEAAETTRCEQEALLTRMERECGDMTGRADALRSEIDALKASVAATQARLREDEASRARRRGDMEQQQLFAQIRTDKQEKLLLETLLQAQEAVVSAEATVTDLAAQWQSAGGEAAMAALRHEMAALQASLAYPSALELGNAVQQVRFSARAAMDKLTIRHAEAAEETRSLKEVVEGVREERDEFARRVAEVHASSAATLPLLLRSTGWQRTIHVLRQHAPHLFPAHTSSGPLAAACAPPDAPDAASSHGTPKKADAAGSPPAASPTGAGASPRTARASLVPKVAILAQQQVDAARAAAAHPKTESPAEAAARRRERVAAQKKAINLRVSEREAKTHNQLQRRLLRHRGARASSSELGYGAHDAERDDWHAHGTGEALHAHDEHGSSEDDFDADEEADAFHLHRRANGQQVGAEPASASSLRRGTYFGMYKKPAEAMKAEEKKAATASPPDARRRAATAHPQPPAGPDSPEGGVASGVAMKARDTVHSETSQRRGTFFGLYSSASGDSESTYASPFRRTLGALNEQAEAATSGEPTPADSDAPHRSVPASTSPSIVVRNGAARHRDSTMDARLAMERGWGMARGADYLRKRGVMPGSTALLNGDRRSPDAKPPGSAHTTDDEAEHRLANAEAAVDRSSAPEEEASHAAAVTNARLLPVARALAASDRSEAQLREAGIDEDTIALVADLRLALGKPASESTLAGGGDDDGKAPAGAASNMRYAVGGANSVPTRTGSSPRMRRDSTGAAAMDVRSGVAHEFFGNFLRSSTRSPSAKRTGSPTRSTPPAAAPALHSAPSARGALLTNSRRTEFAPEYAPAAHGERAPSKRGSLTIKQLKAMEASATGSTAEASSASGGIVASAPHPPPRVLTAQRLDALSQPKGGVRRTRLSSETHNGAELLSRVLSTPSPASSLRMINTSLSLEDIAASKEEAAGDADAESDAVVSAAAARQPEEGGDNAAPKAGRASARAHGASSSVEAAEFRSLSSRAASFSTMLRSNSKPVTTPRAAPPPSSSATRTTKRGGASQTANAFVEEEAVPHAGMQDDPVAMAIMATAAAVKDAGDARDLDAEREALIALLAVAQAELARSNTDMLPASANFSPASSAALPHRA